MSRNRKNQTVAVRFGPALRALSLCLFIGGAGVGYVWQKDQNNKLRERQVQAERKFEKLRRQNDGYSVCLARLQSPAALEAQIKRIDLGLVAPQPDQTVSIVETPPPSDLTTNHNPRLYAYQRPQPWPHP